MIKQLVVKLNRFWSRAQGATPRWSKRLRCSLVLLLALVSGVQANSTLTTDAVSTQPGSVSIVSPTGTIGDPNPNVEWLADSNAAASHYRVVIRNASSSTNLYNQLLSISELEQTENLFSADIGVNLLPGIYKIFIRGQSNNGTGPYSRSTFVVPESSVPSSVSILAPTGSGHGSNPLIEWSSDSNDIASHYRVTIRDASDQTIHNHRYLSSELSQLTNGLSKDLNLNLLSGIYRVWVRGENSAGIGPVSRSVFIVPESSTPGAMAILSPSGSTEENSEIPLTTWTTDSDVAISSFRITIRDSLNANVHNQEYDLNEDVTQSGSNYSIDLGIALPIGDYRMWIRGKNFAGWGPIGPRSTFSILPDTSENPHLIHDVVHSTSYGHDYSGAIPNISNAQFTFDYANSNLLLELDTFDIDKADEVQVLVNGVQIAYLDTTTINASGSSSILIPADYLQSGTNELNLVQKTPGYRWGVSNLILKTQAPLVPAISQYDLVFNDEFNGSNLDSSKWNTGLLWGPYLPINGEEQLYVDTLGIHQNSGQSPFELTGDSLIIRASEVGGNVQPPPRPAEDDPIWDEYREYRYNEEGYDPDNVNYLSGIITTYDTFRMTHGYVEARAKLPTGQGFWPAFWLLNSHYVEDSPEIDIMEFLGHEPDTLYHTYHYFEPHNGYSRVSTPSFKVVGPDWTQGFHTYGMAWSPNEIVWYVDGVETRRITDADFTIPKQGMYILANLAVGGNWPGSPDASTPFPADYEIDYIRAYKKKLSPSLDLEADYQMMFNDEFNGSALDPTKWNTSFLWGPYFAINNEEQYYVDALGSDANIGYTPFDVSNGTLTITAESKNNSPANVPPTSLPGPNESIWSENREFRQGPYEGAPEYTSGLITSYDAFKFVNGYAEIKAKVPAGDGLWPAFWLLNAYYVGNLPEIDIMEILGENASTAYHTYHRSETGGIEVADQFVSSHGTPAIGYSDDFHTFGVRWQPGKITWYVDGQVVDTYEEPPNENHAYQLMYVLANLAVGGDFNSETVDPSALPAKYEIDYIRVYQEKDTP